MKDIDIRCNVLIMKDNPALVLRYDFFDKKSEVLVGSAAVYYEVIASEGGIVKYINGEGFDTALMVVNGVLETRGVRINMERLNNDNKGL